MNSTWRIRRRQTMARGPDLAFGNCLFLRSPRVKNGFYIFKRHLKKNENMQQRLFMAYKV